MNYENVIFEKKGSIAVVTLNRPEKKNALNEQLHAEFVGIIEEIEKSEELKVMLVTGGHEVFSAGSDLSDVTDKLPGGPNAIERVAEMLKPTIAVINGWCVAGGLELALSCDFRIVSEKALIGDRHIRMGLIGGAGSPTRLTRLIGLSKAKELVLTGNVVNGEEAYCIGFANRVFPEGKVMDGAMEFAEKLANSSVTALKLSKKSVNSAMDMSEYESIHQVKLLAEELLASAEFRERVDNFLSKKK